MSIFSKQPPWYITGLAFECSACGQCCAGPVEGYVWATKKELASIAEFLKISEAEMRQRYTRRVGNRITIVERPDNKDCAFLVPDKKGNKKCSIYSVRPSQCRTWPFWPMNLDSPEDWALAGLRCPGINRGKRFSPDEIEERRKQTGH